MLDFILRIICNKYKQTVMVLEKLETAEYNWILDINLLLLQSVPELKLSEWYAVQIVRTSKQH